MDVASMAEPIGEHMAVMKLYIWRYGHYHCLRFLQQAVETIHILASTGLDKKLRLLGLNQPTLWTVLLIRMLL